MMCDNCEKPRVYPDDCGDYQDLEALTDFLKTEVKLGDEDIRKLRQENEALKSKIKSLKADLDLWKNLSKHHYRKMVEAKITLKAEKETSEFLRQEVYRKDAMLARLK